MSNPTQQAGQGEAVAIVSQGEWGKQVHFIANGKDRPPVGTLLYAQSAPQQPEAMGDPQIAAAFNDWARGHDGSAHVESFRAGARFAERRGTPKQPEALAQQERETKVAEVERLLTRFIENDPDAAERFIESQLAQLDLRKRLAAKRAARSSVGGGKMNPDYITVGDLVEDSPVGKGVITGITERGFPQVDHIAVAWCERSDGARFDPYGKRGGTCGPRSSEGGSNG